MPTNEFYPIATGDGANASSSASWQASARRQTGFVTGLVPSPDFNKALRQPAVIASMIGAFMVQQGYDALDNGDAEALLTNFKAALGKVFGGAFPQTALVHTGVASGSATALISTLAPAITAYAQGSLYTLSVPNAATGATTVNFNAIGIRNLNRLDGSAIQAGDWSSGSELLLIDTGSEIRLITAGAPVAASSYWHYGVDTSGTPSAITANVTPDISAYSGGYAYNIVVANNSVSGGTTASFDGKGSRPVTRADRTPIRKGDWTSGQVIILIDDGTNLQLSGVTTAFAPSSASVQFTSSGTFTVPPGVSFIKNPKVWGPGGGGGGSTGTNGAGSGGGGGGYADAPGFAVNPGDVLVVTIGAPGQGGVSGNGTAGGTCSLGIQGQPAILAATGGGFGYYGNNAGSGANAGLGGTGAGPGVTANGGVGSFGGSVGSGGVPASGIGGAGAFGGGSPTPNFVSGSTPGNFPGGGSNGGCGGSNGAAAAGGLITFQY